MIVWHSQNNKKVRQKRFCAKHGGEIKVKLVYVDVIVKTPLNSIIYLLTNQLSRFQISIKNKKLNS